MLKLVAAVLFFSGFANANVVKEILERIKTQGGLNDQQTANALVDALELSGRDVFEYLYDANRDAGRTEALLVAAEKDKGRKATAQVLENLFKFPMSFDSVEAEGIPEFKAVRALCLNSVQSIKGALQYLSPEYDYLFDEKKPSEEELNAAIDLMADVDNLVSRAAEGEDRQLLDAVVSSNTMREAISFHRIMKMEKALDMIQVAFNVEDIDEEMLKTVDSSDVVKLRLAMGLFKKSRFFVPDEGMEHALNLPGFLYAYEWLTGMAKFVHDRPGACREAESTVKGLSEPQKLIKFAEDVKSQNMDSYDFALNYAEKHLENRDNFINGIHRLSPRSKFSDALRYLEQLVLEEREELFESTGFDVAASSDEEIDLVGFLLQHGPSSCYSEYRTLLLGLDGESKKRIIAAVQAAISPLLEECASHSDLEEEECKELAQLANQNLVGETALHSLTIAADCPLLYYILRDGKTDYQSAEWEKKPSQLPREYVDYLKICEKLKEKGPNEGLDLMNEIIRLQDESCDSEETSSVVSADSETSSSSQNEGSNSASDGEDEEDDDDLDVVNA